MPSSEGTAQNDPQSQEGQNAPEETTEDPTTGEALDSGEKTETAAASNLPDEPSQAQEEDSAAPSSAPAKQTPLTRREILERESGTGVWLTLTIGAAGLLLMLLLPWVNVYYLNPMQNLVVGPDGSITFTKEEVVHVVLQGYELLNFNLWPLLILFMLTILLLGAANYWQQTKFTNTKLAWAVLALGLIVGIGFPVELQQLLVANQRVTWTNDHATIEENHNVHAFAKNGGVYICIPKDQNDRSCDKAYSHGIILNAGIDWTEISSDQQPKTLVEGHADGVRESYSSTNVTTSGYATGSFGNMGASFGYWGSWILSLWILLNALVLLRRLLRTLR